MAAVVAAIGAAFLAGAVALYREFHQQQRDFLVAARVMHATFGVASLAIRTSLDSNGWQPVNRMPGKTSFSTAWDSYKGGLAGHLTWSEWQEIETAVTLYLALMNTSQDHPPQDAEDALREIEKSLDAGRDALHPSCIKRLSIWKQARRRIDV